MIHQHGQEESQLLEPASAKQNQLSQALEIQKSRKPQIQENSDMPYSGTEETMSH